MLDPSTKNQPNPPRRRPLSCGVWALGCCGTLVLLLLIGCLSFWLYFRSRDQQALRDIQAEVERIHAAGEPITAEDMAKFHHLPEGVRDTTKLWLNAAKLARDVDSMEELLADSRDLVAKDINGDCSSEVWHEVDKYLTVNQLAVDAGLAAAKADGQARFPMDWEEGIASRLDHIKGLIRLTRILTLRHRLALARDETEKADESLEAMLSIAASLEHEPHIVGQLTRLHPTNAYCTELGSSLTHCAFTDVQLESLQRKLGQLDFHEGLKVALVGDRACGFVAFDKPALLQHDLRGAAKMARGVNGALGRPADCRFYLETMRDLIEAAELPLAQGLPRALAIKAKTDHVVYHGPIWQRMYKRFSASLIGPMPFAFNGFARAQARRDCAVCIVAVRRYHLKHGNLPETLDALVPELLPDVPSDMFASEKSSLRFVVNDGVVTVYSVGMDGIDNGGMEIESDDTNGDVTVTTRFEELKTQNSP